MKSIQPLRSREVVIVAGARTPFGRFMGSFTHISATQLAVHASKEAIVRAGIDPKDIDQSIFGNVMQTSIDAPYLARHVGLHVGMPVAHTALTLNRLCGSGFESILAAAQQILLGQATIVLAGGTENMSMAPYWDSNIRSGYAMGPAKLIDSLQGGLTDAYNGLPMGITAENIAKKWSISREKSDAFSLASQTNYKKAKQEGVFQEEIVPVSVKRRKDTVVINEDEHPRGTTQLTDLKKLRPVFDPEGIVTAGASSGIVDGAAAVIVMSKAEAQRRGLDYLVSIESHGLSGCDPSIMGMGPVQASTNALLACGHTINDIDHVEVNEAFAPQVLAVAHELGIAPGRLNPNGGSIAVGHPLAASGTRIALHAALSLQRKKQQFALVSACIGGGQGIALILKNEGASKKT